MAGQGAETSSRKASLSIVHHYFVVLQNFFNWAVLKQVIKTSPLVSLKIKKPKSRLIIPYAKDEINKMLAVCDFDFRHNALFLGSRNRALIYFLLDTGARLSELTGIKMTDVALDDGIYVVTGKSEKQRKVSCPKAPAEPCWTTWCTVNLWSQAISGSMRRAGLSATTGASPSCNE